MLNKIDKDHNEVVKEQQSKNKLANSLIKLSLIWALTLSSCGSPKNSFNNQQNDITSKLLSKANKLEYIKDNNVIYFKDNNLSSLYEITDILRKKNIKIMYNKDYRDFIKDVYKNVSKKN
mgnify:CR=1 FL=1